MWDGVPAALRERPQWVLWRYVTRDGRRTKMPVKADGVAASSTDPSTWVTFDDVVAAHATGGFDGIGFVFTADDPFVGVDLDDCIDGNGNWDDRREWVERFGTYCEVSPSGRGVKLIGRATKHFDGNRKADPGVECYDRGRFFTITGNLVDGCGEIVDVQAPLDKFGAAYWPSKSSTSSTVVTATASTPTNGHSSDGDVLERMFASQNGDRYRAIYGGQWDAYHGSQSEADLDLAGRLAFFSGGDHGQVDRLFRQSGLYRAKWDEPRGDSTYGRQTIASAFDGRTEFYGDQAGHRNGSGPRNAMPDRTPSARCELVVRRGSEIEPRQVAWRWPGVIPCGYLTLLAGETGVGKGFVQASIIAAITNPRVAFPDGTHADRARDVVIVCFEDAVEDMLLPRMIVAGADRDRLLFVTEAVEYVGDDHTTRAIDIGRHLEALNQLLADEDVGLVAVDPIGDIVRGTDDNAADAVRDAFVPVLTMLRNHPDVALLGMKHPNKNTRETNPLARIAGSTQWVAMSRSVLWVLKDPEDDERRLLLPDKNQHGPLADGHAFRLVEPDRPPNVVACGGVPRAVWEDEPCPLSAFDVLHKTAKDREPRRWERAANWLVGELADAPGQMLRPKALCERAAALDPPFSERLLKNAVGKDPRIVQEGGGSNWRWKLAAGGGM